jgi:hypothetical protein
VKHQPELLYLDLLKKTLSFSLWPEPPIPVTTFNCLRSPGKRVVATALSKTFDWGPLQIVQKRHVSASERANGQVAPLYADTMIGLRRLDSLQHCIEEVLREGIPGDLIETGVWRGGACIFMRAVLAAYGVADRRVFVADSFQGVPKPDARKYPADAGDRLYKNTYLAVPKADVEDNFRRYGLLDDQVVFLEGWFKDTLPGAPFDTLAVMRLDGDLYGSTMDSLESLYPKLSRGGFCVIDDYAMPGCKSAVDDYRATHAIASKIIEIDWTGRYWQKE